MDLSDLKDLPGVTYERHHVPIFRKDRHLSSALITTEIDYMFKYEDNPRALKREHKELLNKLSTTNAHRLGSELFMGWAVSNMQRLAATKNPNQDINRAMNVACEATRISTKDYCGTAVYRDCRPTPLLTMFFNVKTNFDLFIRDVTFSTEFHKEYKIGSVIGDAYGNLHLIWDAKDKCYVVTHSHVVAIRDIANAWFSVLLYAIQEDNKYPGHSLYTECERIWRAGSEAVKELNTNAYLLIKMWPSLVIGSILRDTEGKSDFYDTLRAECNDYAHTRLFEIMTRYVPNQTTAMMFLELAGLWKCFGHPDIDMDLSTKAWTAKGSIMRPETGQVAVLLVCVFRLEFCRQYYRDKHRWPEVTVEDTAPEHIRWNHRHNTWEERVTNPWKAKDFEYVHMQHTLTFDYHVDTSDLISDKSIIPEKAQWIHEYDRQAHRTIHGFFPRGPKPTSKSVVIDYLQQEHVDVKEIIEVIQARQVPDSWKIIIAVGKEKEFKPWNARFYAKMTPQMRLYQTVTESNIAKGIFPYVKHQSMTMSEEQLTRTIKRMNTPSLKLKDEEYVFITVDFSSWCTTFRWELTYELFRDLDRLFGLDHVYTYTHEFPIESHLLFQDRFNPPQQRRDTGDPMHGPRCFRGPEAWLEGLRQKGWTLATIMLILEASWRCGTSASLLGQGDNQVILLRIPPTQQLAAMTMTQDKYIQTFLTTLQQLCLSAGIVIKLEETWHSRSLFEYSRQYHINGAQVSNALKRIARLSSEANQSIPTLNGDIAGIFSTGTTAAGEDCTPVSSYYCTVTEACLLLWNHLPWLKTSPLEDTVALLLLSRTLGGFPITLYSQFSTRAVQDILTSNLHLVRTALKDPSLQGSMRRLVCLRISKHIDFKALIQDPKSLPLDIPRQPENMVRGEVKRGLTTLVKNKAVRALFDAGVEKEEENLIKDLMSITPCNPKLLNKLYGLSNIGLQEKWLAKFANTRSIQKVALSSWSDEKDVLDSVKSMEARCSNYLRTKKEDGLVDRLSITTCITRFAQELREAAWEIPIEGVTMPPQQEQTRLKPWKDLTVDEARRSILIASAPTPPTNREHKKGPYQAYFGSSTRLRARKAPLQVIEVGSTVSSLKQLMELRGWVKGDNMLKELIDRLITEKTDISIDSLMLYTREVYSGCLTHRLPCPALHQSGMANMNLNYASYYLITSDTATRYAKSGVNYTICFQSVFLYGLTNIILYERELGVQLSERVAVVFDCSDCTWVLPPDNFEMTRLSYPGIELGSKIIELHHQDEHASYRLLEGVGYDRSYSVHMARKFAAWIVNRQLTDHISTLENVSLDETITTSFVNLAEFRKLGVRDFINSYVFYCALFDTTFYGKSATFFDDIVTCDGKGPYDTLHEPMFSTTNSTECNECEREKSLLSCT